MKILVIAPTPFFADRGTHIRILEESLALEKLGHEITIVTYHIGKDIQSEVETNIDIRRIRRWLFWYTKLEAGPDWQKILLDLLLIRKALYLAYVQRPDIIHAHIHEGVALGWIVQKCLFWRKIKLVADFHGSLTKEMVSHSYLNGGLGECVVAGPVKFLRRGAGIIMGMVVFVIALGGFPIIEALPAFGRNEGEPSMAVEVPFADICRVVAGGLEDFSHA